jgi:hypothetical protein
MSSSKKLTCKGTLRHVLSEFIDWRHSPSCWYFRPSFVNCCSSSSNLLSGSTLPPPLPCVNKYTIYTSYAVYKGIWGSGTQADKHLPKTPVSGKFFQMTTLCIDFYESYLSTGTTLFITTQKKGCVLALNVTSIWKARTVAFLQRHHFAFAYRKHIK